MELQDLQFQFTDKMRKTLIMLMVVGVVVFGLGILFSSIGGGHQDDHGGQTHVETHQDDKVPADEPVAYPDEEHQEAAVDPEAGHGEHAEIGLMNKISAAVLMNAWFYFCLAIFGSFLIAVKYLSNAGWYVALKRIPEAFGSFLIPMAVVFLIIAVGLLPFTHHHWMGDAAEHDALIQAKQPVLSQPFFIVTVVVFFALWILFSRKLRGLSLKEDEDGGIKWYRKSIVTSAIYLPIFGLTFCLAAFVWLMSLEPHWFSTIYAVNTFASMMITGLAATILISLFLKSRGYLSFINQEHYHDLGKLMFAFTIFWMYTWVSQLLLIWYANIPEETQYYYDRYLAGNGYGVWFYLNIAITFVFPFFMLMTRNAKRLPNSLIFISSVIILGRFIDVFLLVMPGAVGPEWDFGLVVMCLGGFTLFGAAFLMFTFNQLAKASLVPKHHPLLEESLHYDTGI